MRLALTTLAAFGSLLLAGPAPAGGGHDPIAVVEHIFEQADADGSGTVSRVEYANARLERFGVTFEACDANADGETSWSEYLDVYLRHHPSPERSRI